MKSFGVAMFIAISLRLGGAACAQIAPGDAGAGVQLGIQELNNSGQVGTVTLFDRNTQTMAVIEMHGAPNRPETAMIVRAQACETVGPGTVAAFPLSSVGSRRSSSLVKAPLAKLLSGNYSVLVQSAARPGASFVACGHLYQ